MEYTTTNDKRDSVESIIDRLPPSFCRRMERLLDKEYPAFLAGYETPLKRGLRVNTLKCSVGHFLAVFPKKLTPSCISSSGFILEEEHRAGADPLHHAGAYYMQEPSAMSAVAVLDPKPGERVLDLCAAPGGKSTQIAAALNGRGLLWANEYVRPRAQVLAQNIERCGVKNAVVTSTDAHTLCGRLPGFFDAVLVDAPCSGEGMFRKEPAALAQWSEDNIRLCAERQKDILSAAAQAVAPGGRLVYSTCTFAPEEDECQVVRFLTTHPDFELMPISDGLSFGRPGFCMERIAPFISNTESGASITPPLEFTRRIFPGKDGEGHFFALFRRQGSHTTVGRTDRTANDTNGIDALILYKECFLAPPDGQFITVGGLVRLLPLGLPDMKGLGVLCAGAAAAEICKNRLEPCHALFMAASADDCVSLLNLSLGDPRLTAFLRGETVEAPGCRGWTAVAAEGIVTGFGKVSGGILKNRYPKGLRLRSNADVPD